MTGDELIAVLQALPEEQRKLDVTFLGEWRETVEDVTLSERVDIYLEDYDPQNPLPFTKRLKTRTVSVLELQP
jgi:hypothetical protein